MGNRAVLFDLGNTLVAYYGRGFPSVLRRCLRACADALGLPEGSWDQEALFREAMRMNADCERIQRLTDVLGLVGAAAR